MTRGRAVPAERPLLTLVPAGDAQVDDEGRVRLTRKFIDGVLAFGERWEGDVVVSAQAGPRTPFSNVGDGWMSPQDLPFRLTVRDRLVDAIDLTRPGLVHAAWEARREDVAHVRKPLVLTAEFPPVERLRTTLLAERSVTSRARVRAGAARQNLMLRRLLTHSVGVQCNGYPAYDYVRRRHRNALLFFDTRLPRAAVATARPVRAAGALVAAFSGRLVPEKGVLDAVEAVRRARRHGADVRLIVLGDGPAADVVRRAEDGVEFRGPLDFTPDWIDTVGGEVDLMLLPHRQGDPSGTFLEAAGLGVPSLGYDSAAWHALVRQHGLGWAVPNGSVTELSTALVRLTQDRDGIRAAGTRGRDFMREHSFEAEFDQRAEHLARCWRAGRG